MTTGTNYEIVQGTTEPQDFQLYDDGAALVGTGWTVTLVFRETLGVTPPTVAWLSQAAGTVRVSGIDALPVGRYHVRYKLTDDASKFGYAPSGDASDVWHIVRV